MPWFILPLILELCLILAHICIQKLQNGNTLTKYKYIMYLSVTSCLVFAWAMNKQRMEEHNITFFHLKIQSLSSNLFIFLNAKVCFINLAIPIRIDMIKKPTFKCFRQYIQWTIFLGCILKWCPCCNYSVSRAKWKIC